MQLPAGADITPLVEAIAPENRGFVRTQRRAHSIAWIVEADSAGRVRATVDDLMAGLKVAEATLMALQASTRSRKSKAHR